ncbi:MAG TPA: hypothetical protein VJ844_01555 [Mucilaginibacter sp.]|nr:hypothetical protein [Mucilaginibacter sp.]
MKKTMAMIALAAICFGSSAYAITPVKMTQDTTKKDTVKVKVKKKGTKVKIKKKVKDTTAIK